MALTPAIENKGLEMCFLFPASAAVSSKAREIKKKRSVFVLLILPVFRDQKKKGVSHPFQRLAHVQSGS